MAKFQVGDKVRHKYGDKGEVLFIGKTTYLIGYYIGNNKDSYIECSYSFDVVDKSWRLIPKEVVINLEIFEKAWNKTQNVNSMTISDHYKNSLAEELGL